jgi:hypothetical protein
MQQTALGGPHGSMVDSHANAILNLPGDPVDDGASPDQIDRMVSERMRPPLLSCPKNVLASTITTLPEEAGLSAECLAWPAVKGGCGESGSRARPAGPAPRVGCGDR